MRTESQASHCLPRFCPSRQSVFVRRLEQAQLASLLRESVDVALFPNRCEGGTNLVAMEAAASGVPLLVTRGTGQADLHDMLGGHVLAMDGTVVDDVEGEEGWMEADVDEVREENAMV